MSRSGRFDMPRLKQAMLLLIANDGPLGPEWSDHPLKGDWDGHRECHVGGTEVRTHGAVANAGGINADDFTTQVQERPAGVAMPDFSVMLDIGGQPAHAREGAISAVDGSFAHRIRELTKSVADGNHFFARSERLGVTECGHAWNGRA